MGVRIFCDKCMQMSIANPTKYPAHKCKTYEAKCGCTFKNTELKDIEVKTKYYTKKHGDLINNRKKISTIWNWEFRKVRANSK